MKLYILVVESFAIAPRCFVRNDLEEIDGVKHELLLKGSVESSTYFRVFEAELMGYEATEVNGASEYALFHSSFSKET